jgi:hypothetical protein
MKERLLTVVKLFIIALNTAGLVSITLIIILVPGSLIDTGVGKSDVKLSIAIIMYILLAITGSALLMQIREYFTQIPRYLVISKYIIIANVTIALATTSLQMTVKEMYSPEVS